MRYGNKPIKIEKSVGESGFFTGMILKLDISPIYFRISWPYLYWYARRSKAAYEKAVAELFVAQNCKDYGVIYRPESHILRHVEAIFLFVFIKT